MSKRAAKSSRKRKLLQKPNNTSSGGFAAFADEVHPDVVADILKWNRLPELERLASALRSHQERKAFFDSYAEAVVARQLLQHGCQLRFEVQTPAGKHCDFEVQAGEVRFFLHVKRLETERPAHTHLTISPRWRVLERIRRPYIVQVRWREGATDRQMQRLITQASDFLRAAHVGDEWRCRDEQGRELGGVRVLAPWEGSHVSVTIGMPRGFVDQRPRYGRMLQRAYEQFMPRSVNVILIASSHVPDAHDFESALLGSHIERWDAFPPRGRRVAHGRASDGFWTDRKHDESHAAGWFMLTGAEPDFDGKLWIRPDHSLKPELTDLLQRLFDTHHRARS